MLFLNVVKEHARTNYFFTDEMLQKTEQFISQSMKHFTKNF